MRKKVTNAIGFIVLSVFIVGLSSIMAGGFGALLGLCVVIAVLARFLAYLGFYALPSVVKKLTGWIIFITIISILAVWGASLWERADQEHKAKQAKTQAQAQIEFDKKLQRFYLPPCNGDECEEVPTVDAGPGTRHRLRADAPYRIMSNNQPDGKRITYPMPEGWETWTGEAPAGKLRLMNAKGAKEKVLVEIIRAQ